MITFEKTITDSENKSFYLNITDDYGEKYGVDFPDDKSKLSIITNNKIYKASKRGKNQIWGVLRSWYEGENITSGCKIRINYNPNFKKIEDRIPIYITVLRKINN